MDTSNEIKLQEEYIKKVKKINQDKNLKYTILTMGCQLNENDSEKLCGMLEKMGYTKTEKQNDADLALFNTCCVRENAEDKLFGKLGELKRLKEQKGIIIAIGGCMMQEKHITDKIKESYPFVDILFGTHTHVQTNDDTIYETGMGYITDVGMTGPKDSIIGMAPEAALKRFLTQIPERYACASGEPMLNAVVFEFDEKAKKVTRIDKISI